MKRQRLARIIYFLSLPCCFILFVLAAAQLSHATRARRPNCRGIPNRDQYIVSLAINTVFGSLMFLWAFIAWLSLHYSAWYRYYPERRIRYRTRSFYHVIINICGIVPLIVAVQLGPNVRLTLSPDVCSTRVPICSNKTNMFSFISIRSDRTIGEVCLFFRFITILGYIVIAMYGILCISLSSEMILPARVRGTIQIGIRSLERVLQSLRKTQDTPAHRPLHIVDQGVSEGEKQRKPNLEAVLRNQEIALAVASNLHFIDVVNLGMSSRSLQAVFFRRRGRQNQREVIRVVSCTQGQKMQCWTCGMQTCNECKISSRLQPAPATTHLVNCSSYCTKCFYLKVCIHPYQNHKEDASCQCSPSQNSPGHDLAVFEHQCICRNCAALPKDGALEIRNRRELHGLQIMQSRNLQCSGCAKRLPINERRWWACSLCNQECMREEHYSPRG